MVNFMAAAKRYELMNLSSFIRYSNTLMICKLFIHREGSTDEERSKKLSIELIMRSILKMFFYVIDGDGSCMLKQREEAM